MPNWSLAGTYTRSVIYEGDANNNAAIDQGGRDEQDVVAAASPEITTTPNPTETPLGGRLQDVADLTGGFDLTGSITFNLYAPGVDPTVGPAAFTETVTVNGAGMYSTAVGFVANMTGVWHWVATYSGDGNNNLASTDPLDEPVTIPAAADLTLTKMADMSQVVIGEPFTYVLTVHNLGPDVAIGAAVNDPFPSGIALVGPFLPSQGAFDPVAGVWSIGTLFPGASATLLVGAQVEILGPVTNSATVHADQSDPDQSNNTGSAVVTGMRPANMVSKLFFFDSFDPPAVDPGRVAPTAGVSGVTPPLPLRPLPPRSMACSPHWATGARSGRRGRHLPARPRPC